jgi:hypothetical protein
MFGRRRRRKKERKKKEKEKKQMEKRMTATIRKGMGIVMRTAKKRSLIGLRS